VPPKRDEQRMNVVSVGVNEAGAVWNRQERIRKLINADDRCGVHFPRATAVGLGAAVATGRRHRKAAGEPGNPAGRLRGSRNRLSEAVICALLRDFDKHGEKAIARVREENLGMYLKVIAMVLPRQHKVEHRNPLKELTDEELEAMIEHIKVSMEAQAQSAKLIEGEAVPSLPSPVSAKNS